MSLLDQLSRPVIFAHRGVSSHAPENTLAAFQLALEHNADGIELDAKLSADQQVVVIHDQSVDRTTGSTGVVRHLPLKVLKKLDVGQFFSPQFTGERIPTLDEVFQAIGDKLLINVELTNYMSTKDALPEKVAELVQKYALENCVLFSSFLPSNLTRIHDLLPDSPIALLALPGIEGKLARSSISRKISPNIIHPHHSDVTLRLKNREKAAGRRVHPWTVNSVTEMERLFELQVDGIITDDPRLARQILENQ
jgi:glycerophosphoryl diester phosphodiesterase